MRPITRITLKELPTSSFMHEYRRRIYLDGRAGPIIHGDEISAQFECGVHILLIMNYDWFEGTSHWFYLLNSHGHVVDQTSTPDYFGFIGDITFEEPSIAKFGFFGTNDKWTLTVNETGVWSFSLADLIRRPNRFLLSKRRLSLRCVKGEPWEWPSARQGIQPDGPASGGSAS